MQLVVPGVVALLFLGGKAVLDERVVRPSAYRPSLLPLQASYQGTSLKRFSFGMDSLLADLLCVLSELYESLL